MSKYVVEILVGNVMVVTSSSVGVFVPIFIDDFDCSGKTMIDSLELADVSALLREYVDTVDELKCVSTGGVVEPMISDTVNEVFKDASVCISHSNMLVVVLRSIQMGHKGEPYQSFA